MGQAERARQNDQQEAEASQGGDEEIDPLGEYLGKGCRAQQRPMK